MDGKIVAVSNKEKTIWFTLRYYDGIVEDLHNLILECMDDNKEYPSIGLNFYDEEQDENYLLPYKEMVGRDYDFYDFEGESIILIFYEDRVKIILLKDSSKFDELREEIMDRFEIAENKPND